jgi:hypothetical protein
MKRLEATGGAAGFTAGETGSTFRRAPEPCSDLERDGPEMDAARFALDGGISFPKIAFCSSAFLCPSSSRTFGEAAESLERVLAAHILSRSAALAPSITLWWK